MTESSCIHRVFGNISVWPVPEWSKIKPFSVGTCKNPACGTTKAFRKYEFQELTKESGVFNHTPHSDRRRALGLR